MGGITEVSENLTYFFVFSGNARFRIRCRHNILPINHNQFSAPNLSGYRPNFFDTSMPLVHKFSIVCIFVHETFSFIRVQIDFHRPYDFGLDVVLRWGCVGETTRGSHAEIDRLVVVIMSCSPAQYYSCTRRLKRKKRETDKE